MQRTFGHRLAELENQAGASLGTGQDVLQCVGEQLDLIVTGDQGRQQLDDVHVVGRHLGQDVVTVEQRGHHHLREQRWSDRFHHFEAAAEPRRRWLAEDQPDHQPLPADLVEELVFLDQRFERLGECLPGALHPVEDVLVVERGRSMEL